MHERRSRTRAMACMRPSAAFEEWSVILERLREETRAEHERIERSLDLTRPGRTARDVAGLLVGFYGFYAPWERAAGGTFAAAGMGAFFERRRKVLCLERDLRFHLGEGADVSSLPACDRMPDMTSVPKALGSMYVLEGSTLGGQIIARHFRRHVPGLEDGRGCSFFECYGAGVGMMWREFQGVLRAHSTSRGADDTMVAAARETFVLLQDWLHDTAVRQADHE